MCFYAKVSKVGEGRQNFTGWIIADDQGRRIEDLKTQSIILVSPSINPPSRSWSHL